MVMDLTVNLQVKLGIYVVLVPTFTKFNPFLIASIQFTLAYA